jgi:hypothetical protein
MKPSAREKYSWFDKFGIAAAAVFAAFIVFSLVSAFFQYTSRAKRDIEARNAERVRELQAEQLTNVSASANAPGKGEPPTLTNR